MLFDLFLVLNLVAALYVWFETDAFIEWGRLFRLKFLKFKEYEDSKTKIGSFPLYVEWLEFNYAPRSFLLRLITCPICLSVWCNILLVMVTSIPIILLGTNIIITWVGYFMLFWIIKKSHE